MQALSCFADCEASLDFPLPWKYFKAAWPASLHPQNSHRCGLCAQALSHLFSYLEGQRFRNPTNQIVLSIYYNTLIRSCSKTSSHLHSNLEGPRLLNPTILWFYVYNITVHIIRPPPWDPIAPFALPILNPEPQTLPGRTVRSCGWDGTKGYDGKREIRWKLRGM